jgi:HNH endonuclease
MTETSQTPATLDNELETMATRRKISETIRQVVLLEAGYKCANPTCRHVLTLELHHIVWVKDSGGNQPDNLLALCPNCHSFHTRGHIPAQAILAWKSLLTSLGNPNRAAVDLLLVLADEEERVGKETDSAKAPPPFRFTGDSLPALAPLLTSGLVEISRRFLGATIFGGAHPSFEVSLTERGRRLVAAWRAGSPEAIENALTQPSGG